VGLALFFFGGFQAVLIYAVAIFVGTQMNNNQNNNNNTNTNTNNSNGGNDTSGNSGGGFFNSIFGPAPTQQEPGGQNNRGGNRFKQEGNVHRLNN